VGEDIAILLGSGEIRHIAHGKQHGQKTAQEMEANPVLDRLSVEDHLVAGRVTKGTGSLPSNLPRHDGAALVPGRSFVDLCHVGVTLKKGFLMNITVKALS
jgi:hypothetical protein